MIDLAELTRGEVHNLVGHDRGVSARELFKLDEADRGAEPIEVKVPGDLYTITPSFFQGMFAESVRLAGSRDKFFARYKFDADQSILAQIERGIDASLMRRGSLFKA